MRRKPDAGTRQEATTVTRCEVIRGQDRRRQLGADGRLQVGRLPQVQWQMLLERERRLGFSGRTMILVGYAVLVNWMFLAFSGDGMQAVIRLVCLAVWLATVMGTPNVIQQRGHGPPSSINLVPSGLLGSPLLALLRNKAKDRPGPDVDSIVLPPWPTRYAVSCCGRVRPDAGDPAAIAYSQEAGSRRSGHADAEACWRVEATCARISML